MSKDDDAGRKAELRHVAQAFRDFHNRYWKANYANRDHVEQMASLQLKAAVDLGAFAGAEYIELRHLISLPDTPIVDGHDKPESSVDVLETTLHRAVWWLLKNKHLPAWMRGRSDMWFPDAYGGLARLIQKQANINDVVSALEDYLNILNRLWGLSFQTVPITYNQKELDWDEKVTAAIDDAAEMWGTLLPQLNRLAGLLEGADIPCNDVLKFIRSFSPATLSLREKRQLGAADCSAAKRAVENLRALNERVQVRTCVPENPRRKPTLSSAASLGEPEVTRPDWKPIGEALRLCKFVGGEGGYKFADKIIEDYRVPVTKVGEGKGVRWVKVAPWIAALATAGRLLQSTDSEDVSPASILPVNRESISTLSADQILARNSEAAKKRVRDRQKKIH